MDPDNENPKLTQVSPTIADDDDREPTKEDIMEDIRQGLRDAIAGKNGMPAHEFLEELIRERDMKSLQAVADD